ncbi:MAG TPA: zinc-binding dehydrogenase, partial [Candidatus Acidoferrales bacterium]|nr:zinc-binding dehydrogenase [Candidatus Acidoferrales bacterium]
KTRALGADEVIVHTRQQINAEVKRITNKRGVDVVFEHVGEATWPQSVASLAVGGRLVTCGATTGYEAKIDLRFLFSRQLSLLGSYMGSKAELFPVLDLVAHKKLHPVLDQVFPLAEAASAHRHLEDRAQFGKIVLKV